MYEKTTVVQWVDPNFHTISPLLPQLIKRMEHALIDVEILDNQQ
ncbi:MAG: hypothetical protein ACK5MA_10175 [Parachlamydiaceae bacterium]